MSSNRLRSSDNVLLRISKKLFMLLLVVGIPVMLFLFTFGLKKVNIVGTERYTKDQIQEMVLQSRADYNSVYLYLKYRFFEKPQIPFIEKFDVEMVDRHTVTIYVYEKMVAGCVEFMGEYLYFDKDGIVVESSPEKLEHVPVIRGLEFNEIILNKKLEVQNDELFDIIINLTQLIDKYELDVDTISFSSNNEVTAECGDIKVLLGKKSTYDEVLSDLKNILKKAEGMELEELDMRNYKKGTGYVIGKKKESTD
jgi:cell division protein FtsQ